MSACSVTHVAPPTRYGLRAILLASTVTLAGLLPAAGLAATQVSGGTGQIEASCPTRVRTLAATPAEPEKIAGFTQVVGGETSSQAWLQDVAVHIGPPDTGVAQKGKAVGRRQLVWSFDGTSEVFASCLYEGGISLTRAVGRPSTCTATIQRSKDSINVSGWGMEQASFRCR